MKLALVRACTRSACFELQNNTCYTAPAPFRVQLNGQTVLEACCTNVFSVFSLEPGKTYHLEVLATDGDTGTLDFATAAESFFVDASRYGLVNDGVTDNTAFLQAALSTCPPGGTVYVPAGTYRTQSLFLCSNTTLYLEKGCTLLGGTSTDFNLMLRRGRWRGGAAARRASPGPALSPPARHRRRAIRLLSAPRVQPPTGVHSFRSPAGCPAPPPGCSGS